MSATLSRRTLIGAAATVPLVALATASCAAAPAVTAVFNPVVDSWLADLAIGIGATALGAKLSEGLDDLWADWTTPVTDSLQENTNYLYNEIFGHPVPPVLLVGLCSEKTKNPKADRLAAYVESGQAVVIFEPWAWQCLSHFINEFTGDRTGDDLAAYRALLALSLAPSGVSAETGESPQGSVEYITYEARNGTVELSRLDSKVQISVSAIPTEKNEPTVRTYDLA